jgi:hypothetical protein
LRAAGEQAALLDSMDGDEQQYESVVGQQISRLKSLDLLGDVDSGGTCPVYASRTDDDASVDELRRAAEDLGAQLASAEAIRPRRRQATPRLG